MRTWVVEGIDQSTGNIKRMTVRAQDESMASTEAGRKGLTPQRVYVHTPEANRPIEYASPAAPPDKYQVEAEKTGKRLRAADQILSVIGWLYLGLGILLLVGAVLRVAKDPSAITYLIQGVVFAGISIIFFGAGAALRMLAVMGEKAAGNN